MLSGFESCLAALGFVSIGIMELLLILVMIGLLVVPIGIIVGVVLYFEKRKKGGSNPPPPAVEPSDEA